jgi:hypothetical protein
MRNWMLAAGAAALAVAAPALADPNKGGKGGPKGGQQAEQGQRGGGAARERGGKSDFARAERGGAKGHASARRDDNRAVKAARVDDRDAPGRGRDKDDVRVVRADDDRRDRDRDAIRARDFDGDRRFAGRGFARGFVDGCPPGLAKKDNGCLPPGQAHKIVGTLLPAAFSSRALMGPYRDWYRDDDRFLYRTGPDGLIYRVNRANSLIDALIPSRLDDFSYYPVGMAYPSPYNFYNVPGQYARYWPDNDDYFYRYGNGAIYQVDPQTSMIRSIVALLAGDLSVGQPLPLGYSTYNVPLAYRAQYYDTPDAWYRYNDGYVYRVDPTTQLVTAVIRALV